MLDPLTLDQLRVLNAVAETGSFSGAARKLGRVQSAISQSVQALETTLGVSLFDRSTRTPQVTEAGLAILEDSRALLRQVEAIRARAASVAEGLEAELTLAVDALFPMPPLMESLKGLRVEFPTLPLTLFTEGLGSCQTRIKEGSARLGIYAITPQTDPELETEFLANVALIPVVAATHPLARLKGPLSTEVLREHVQLVLTERFPSAQALSAGIVSDHIWRFADMSARLDFLLEGFGFCRMPRHLVEAHLESGRLVRLNMQSGNAFDVPVGVGRRRGRGLGKAGQWLVADLRERLKACPSTALTSAQRAEADAA